MLAPTITVQCRGVHCTSVVLCYLINPPNRTLYLEVALFFAVCFFVYADNYYVSFSASEFRFLRRI